MSEVTATNNCGPMLIHAPPPHTSLAWGKKEAYVTLILFY